jgi:hypothetical protein
VAKTKRFQVYQYIVDHPGVSDKDIQTALDMNPNTQRPRRIELETVGLIAPVGEDAYATGRVLYRATGKEYPIEAPPGFWRSRMREHRAAHPTPEEIKATVEVMRKAYHVIPDFPKEAVKVLRWLAAQSEAGEL